MHASRNPCTDGVPATHQFYTFFQNPTLRLLRAKSRGARFQSADSRAVAPLAASGSKARGLRNIACKEKSLPHRMILSRG